MMANRSRILILVASLALGLLYVLPVWTIDLEAPQYPEGLGMVIKLNTIEGQKPHDLNNINNLNHYIGMQEIVPESIPELRVMPIVVAVLMITGVGVAALGRRRLLYAWTAGFLAISVVGLVDFWKWEYDYGHNLDPTAAIQVPGMSYQPPLIGSRQILNFTAHSWPASGGTIAILAAVTAMLLSVSELKQAKASRERSKAANTDGPSRSDPPTGPDDVPAAHAGAATTVAVLLLSMLAGCAEPAPRPLLAGVDDCADCLMIVDASGHGAEIVTTTGKVHTFDSAECMVNYLLHGEDAGAIHSAWVTDFGSPSELVSAEEAYYLVSPTLNSPMGLGITAFGRAQDRDGAVHSFGGEATDWTGVKALVAGAWPEGRPPMKHGGHATSLAPEGPRLGG
jgi:copper chaperone NosL